MSLLLALTAAGGGPVNYALTCDAGAYTYTGQAATLKVARSLVCDAGAYVYAGVDATLQVSRSLACDAGAYAYAGVDATLTYVAGGSPISYTLACDAGAYVISGGAATLAYVSGATATSSGGWLPHQRRRKTRKEVYEERVKLGILPPAIVKAAAKVAEVAATVEEFKAERPRYEEMFLRELRATKWAPSYTRAIEAQLKMIEQDDEEILLLM